MGETLDEGDIPSNHVFFSYLPDGDAEDEQEEADESKPSIFRLSDASGSMEMTLVLEGSLDRSVLDSNDVFIVDTTKHVYIWVGKGASIDERRNAMTYAHNYLMKSSHPLLPITVVTEGKETKDLQKAL